ncbi:MAG TPA: pantoate--beta-alanine ligase [Bacillales bacterium]|nr:pantoate--beta-alanine ligase [Bacillales bacterium]
MIIIQSIQEMQQAIVTEKKNGHSIGFVPTMGYLHEGHLSLAERASQENDFVVMSVFVNPLQFGPNEDFDQYPRNFEQDEQYAKKAGVDVIFYPSIKEMYPNEPTVTVKVKRRTDVLCGQSRPGHFDGVATVLSKLFNIVMPDRVYFGMKDAQQVAVVDGLISDMNFPIKLVACPTVREEDGLAKSSRNVNLSETERQEAPVLYDSLKKTKEVYETGERHAGKLKMVLKENLNDRLNLGNLDYAEVLTYPDLEQTDRCNGKIIVALAVKYSRARLIDNIVLDEGEMSC